jgi:hypothetical protein
MHYSRGQELLYILRFVDHSKNSLQPFSDVNREGKDVDECDRLKEFLSSRGRYSLTINRKRFHPAGGIIRLTLCLFFLTKWGNEFREDHTDRVRMISACVIWLTSSIYSSGVNYMWATNQVMWGSSTCCGPHDVLFYRRKLLWCLFFSDEETLSKSRKKRNNYIFSAVCCEGKITLFLLQIFLWLYSSFFSFIVKSEICKRTWVI